MSIEFTGERVVAGQVDRNLWNEHLARYAFASRLCRGRRVLDLGCGTAYGSDELASLAHRVTAVDIDPGALRHAASLYSKRNLEFTAADAGSLPFRNASFDLVVAFEVIEHLENWREMLEEIRRVLAPGGQLIVSTPNKLYYAESRRNTGPNPFHRHEFEYEEFLEALRRDFPYVSLFLQNHSEGLLFQSTITRGAADVRFESATADASECSYFVGVCAMTPQTGSPVFLYIPKSGNILREREHHIYKLEGELQTKDGWLAALQEEHRGLVERFREQTKQLEERNRWAAELDDKLRSAGERIAALQNEVLELHRGYKSQIASLENENLEKTDWANSLTAELQAKRAELLQAIAYLDAAEKTVVERTEWAQRLEGQLNLLKSSPWFKLAKKIGLGPELRKM
jgi:ubiquinone/menaquinone biosynthesis C-methylase UbiE